MRPSMKKSTDSFVTEWHPVYFFIPVFEHPVEMPALETHLDALTRKLGREQPMSDTPKMWCQYPIFQHSGRGRDAL